MVGMSLLQQHGCDLFKKAGQGILLVLVCLVVQCAATAQEHSQDPSTPISVEPYWPHLNSNLEQDPDAVFGCLPNGIRYVLMENNTPTDRVSMHLYMMAGSLAEAEHERGVAHFLEHMLFNGSTHFAPGEMVKYFQRIGMQFGPDANAHTGFDQTVYDIILPDGNRSSLAEALVVLKDYAQGALLLPEEVERERNVILAEMRSRDSSRYRTFKATLKFEMPGLIIGDRLPIGDRTVIEKADASLLRRFYDAWYRPERMVIVMVGDFSTTVAHELIKEQFGDLKPRSEKRDMPLLGRMQHSANQFFYHQDVEAGATTVAIETMVQAVQPRDSIQRQKEELLEDLAAHIMQKRLDALMQQPDAIFTSADNGTGYFLRQIKYAEIRAVSKPSQWQEAIHLLEQTLRKAIRYGFTQTEIEVAKGDFLSELKRAAQEQETRESKAIARDIMSSIGNWTVYQSPAQRYHLMEPLLETVTLNQVNQVFAKSWQPSHRLVLVTGNVDLTSGKAAPAKQIETTYLASLQKAVAPPKKKKRAQFPYLPEPTTSGLVMERRQDATLGIEKVVFDNGFTLVFKPTRFKVNQVLAALSFGRGKSSEPISQPGLAQWTEAVVNESGLGALDRLELEDALAGRWAGFQLDVQEDMFVLKGETVTSELALLMQLLYTAVQDPGYRAEAYHLVFRQFEQQGQELLRTIDGMMELHGRRFLSGGDSRFGTPNWKRFQQCTLDQAKQWYGAQLRQAPMELAVVGDFDPGTLVALVARYFGTLPKREKQFKPPDRPDPVFPAGEALRLTAGTRIEKALVVVAYPTEDFWDIQRTRRLSMLAELFSERLRQHIREELGAAYSPFAYNHSHRSYHGYGVFQIQVLVDPNLAETIVNEVHILADKLASAHHDLDEFRRVLDPTLTYIKDLRQTNTYWLNSVLKGSGRHPEQLEWARTFEQDYAAITLDEVIALAQTYLDNDKAASIVITPTEKVSEQP